MFDPTISEQEIERFYTTREVLSPEYQEHLDAPLTAEQEKKLDEWVKQIPF